MRYKEITYRNRATIKLRGSPDNNAEIAWTDSPFPEYQRSLEGRRYPLGPRYETPKIGGEYFKVEVPGSELDSFKDVLRSLGINSGPVVRVWNQMRKADEEFAEKERKRYRAKSRSSSKMSI